MKRFLFYILTLATAFWATSATDDSKLLDQCVRTLKTSPSLKLDYQLTSNGQTTDGTITLAGDKFAINSPALSIWFDGKTQWTLSQQMKEVNVTTPTAEELQQTNPLLLINQFRSQYKAQRLKDTSGNTTIKLTPVKKTGEIDAAVVTLDGSTKLPRSIVLTLSNRHTVSIKISTIIRGGKLSDSAFRFNSRRYPGFDVIDLR